MFCITLTTSYLSNATKFQKLDVAQALYSCSWYRLPNHLSKNIGTAINFIQNARVPSIGPLGNLDYTAANTVSIC